MEDEDRLETVASPTQKRHCHVVSLRCANCSTKTVEKFDAQVTSVEDSTVARLEGGMQHRGTMRSRRQVRLEQAEWDQGIHIRSQSCGAGQPKDAASRISAQETFASAKYYLIFGIASS